MKGKKPIDQSAFLWMMKHGDELKWATADREQVERMAIYLIEKDETYFRLRMAMLEAQSKQALHMHQKKVKWDRDGWPPDFDDVVNAARDNYVRRGNQSNVDDM